MARAPFFLIPALFSLVLTVATVPVAEAQTKSDDGAEPCSEEAPEPINTLSRFLPPGLAANSPTRAAVPDTGTNAIADRDTFDGLSRRDDVPGALGVREVKFLMTGVDTPNPQIWFINTKNFQFHYFFARDALNVRLSNAEFNARTYFTDNRQFIAGSIIAHDSYERSPGDRGVYTVEFWPTDPVNPDHTTLVYETIKAGMPFAAAEDRILYHPAGATQERIFKNNKSVFEARGIPVITNEELFKNVTYSPLNLGEGYGVLRIMDGASSRPPSVRDVVVFRTLPNDLSHVSGVITDLPQTPLSHINLKAKQNNTPNAYVKNASQDPNVLALEGKIVHYQVTPDGYVLEEASQADADAYFESIRPSQEQHPARDLVYDIQSLEQIGNEDIVRFGAKAANVAELGKILPDRVVPDGFAVPFGFYDDFMKVRREPNGDIAADQSDTSKLSFYDEVDTMIADADFKRDPAVREERLEDFRDRIEDAEVPEHVSDALDYWHHLMQPRAFDGNGNELPVLERPVVRSLRARSSTNNEDLEGFNGAGLYDSFTHRTDEGHFENSAKQVWASLWNYRAFEERDFYRIDHKEAAMGVLVHPNFDDETANGVAVTKNIYDPNWPGMYVNVQAGESLVTNPDAGATPDEFLMARLGPRGEYETQFIQNSNLLPSEDDIARAVSAANTDGSVGIEPDELGTLLRELGFSREAREFSDIDLDSSGIATPQEIVDSFGAVMAPRHVVELRRYMERIQDHFKEAYGWNINGLNDSIRRLDDGVYTVADLRRVIPFIASSTPNPLARERLAAVTGIADDDELVAAMRDLNDRALNFAMDIEFKVTVNGQLAIKQARPWVD